MILCEINEKCAKVQSNKKYQVYKISDFKKLNWTEEVFFINSNAKLDDFLEKKENFINLQNYFSLNTIYENLDVHRTAACYGIDDGVIINADNIISVDFMWRKLHLGGFIMPGISLILDSYQRASAHLKRPFKSQLDLAYLPQNLDDAISYGILKPFILTIEDVVKNKKIYLTGPDGQYFLQHFSNSVYDRDIVFNGLKNLLAEHKELLKEDLI